ITVTNPAKMLAEQIFGARGNWKRPLDWYRAITAQLLPSRLRDAFGLPFEAAEQSKAQRALSSIRRFYPLLPHRLRYVGPYQEAQERLSGRMEPALMTKML